MSSSFQRNVSSVLRSSQSGDSSQQKSGIGLEQQVPPWGQADECEIKQGGKSHFFLAIDGVEHYFHGANHRFATPPPWATQTGRVVMAGPARRKTGMTLRSTEVSGEVDIVREKLEDAVIGLGLGKRAGGAQGHPARYISHHPRGTETEREDGTGTLTAAGMEAGIWAAKGGIETSRTVRGVSVGTAEADRAPTLRARDRSPDVTATVTSRKPTATEVSSNGRGHCPPNTTRSP